MSWRTEEDIFALSTVNVRRSQEVLVCNLLRFIPMQIVHQYGE